MFRGHAVPKMVDSWAPRTTGTDPAAGLKDISSCLTYMERTNPLAFVYPTWRRHAGGSGTSTPLTTAARGASGGPSPPGATPANAVLGRATPEVAPVFIFLKSPCYEI